GADQGGGPRPRRLRSRAGRRLLALGGGPAQVRPARRPSRRRGARRTRRPAGGLRAAGPDGQQAPLLRLDAGGLPLRPQAGAATRARNRRRAGAPGGKAAPPRRAALPDPALLTAFCRDYSSAPPSIQRRRRRISASPSGGPISGIRSPQIPARPSTLWIT